MKILGFNPGWNERTLALRVAAVLLGPTLLAIAGGLVKSAAMAGIKGGLMVYDRGKGIAAEARETIEELSAEACCCAS